VTQPRRYLAHVQLRPRDGSPPVVVETEFQAISYPTAWQHVLSMGTKFDATIMSHKLIEVDEDGVLNGDVTVLPLPQQIASEMPKPTLTVKESDLDWYGEIMSAAPKPVPYPYPPEEKNDDSVAI
jgi:hypothetical protein